MRKIIQLQSVAFALITNISCSPTANQEINRHEKEITLREVSPEKKIDVLIGGELFTSYRWPDNVYKPILYPIVSSGGSIVTRGFPLEPRAGERNDHRHQVGNWLNYGNVNGFDFWGNGHSGAKLPNGGEIRHTGIIDRSEGRGEASLTTGAEWVDPSGKELMAERTRFHFISRGNLRIIDRITTLTVPGTDTVRFKDTKEGMFGLRVARALELPSDEKISLIDASGTPAERQATNEGVTGNYRSSEGVTGEAVWSTRARWMNLYGDMNGEKVAVVICDHPDNISYPTWWHARGYGLFSANPLGAKDFTKGKQELNLSLPPAGTLTLRYRLAIFSGMHPSDQEINKLADEFAEKY